MAESVVVIKKLLQLKVRLFILHTTLKVVQFHTWVNTLPSVKKPAFDLLGAGWKGKQSSLFRSKGYFVILKVKINDKLITKQNEKEGEGAWKIQFFGIF